MTSETMPIPAVGMFRRGQIWWWKIKPAKAVRHLYPEGGWACRCSLETSDLRDAIGLAVRLRAEWHARFEEQARASMPQDVARVTPDMGKLFAQQTLRNTLTEQKTRSDPVERRAHLRYHRRLGIVGMQVSASELGIMMDEKTPGAHEAFGAYLDELQSSLLATVATLPPEVNPDKVRQWKLRDVFDKWKLAEGVGLKAKSVQSREHALMLYERQSGNPPIRNVTREDANAFKAWIVDKTVSKAPKTAHDRLVYVKALFTYAHENLEWLEANPFTLIKHAYKTMAPSTNWTIEEVLKFFALPLFQNYELQPTQGRSGADAAYWIPLLGLFTGARLGELVQLTTDDLVKTGGEWFIEFDETEGKGLKSPASTRRIPLHSELVRLGLTEYASDMRNSGHKRKSLWPKLHLNKDRPSHGFSLWFSEEPRKWVPGTPMFKWLRNTVETVLVEAELDGPIRARLLGHAVKGHEGDRTYSTPTVILRTGVERVRYPGLALPRVYKPAKAIADAQAGVAAAAA